MIILNNGTSHILKSISICLYMCVGVEMNLYFYDENMFLLNIYILIKIQKAGKIFNEH